MSNQVGIGSSGGGSELQRAAMDAAFAIQAAPPGAADDTSASEPEPAAEGGWSASRMIGSSVAGGLAQMARLLEAGGDLPADPAGRAARQQPAAPPTPAPTRARSLDMGGLTLQQQLAERLQARTSGVVAQPVRSFVGDTGSGAGGGAADDDWDVGGPSAPAAPPRRADGGGGAGGLDGDLAQALEELKTGQSADWGPGAESILAIAGRDGNDAVPAALGEILTDPKASDELKARVLALLERIGTPAAAAAVAKAAPALEGDLAVIARDKLKALVGALGDAVRRGDPEAARALGQVLSTQFLEPEEVASAVEALIAADTAEAAESLAGALRVIVDPDLHQRAVDRLGARAGGEVEALLPAGVRARLEREGRTIAEAAGRGDPEVLAAIERALVSRTTTAAQSEGLVRLLQAAGTPAATAALARAATSLTDEGLEAAVSALEALGPAGYAGALQAFREAEGNPQAQAKLLPVLARAAAEGDNGASYALVLATRGQDPKLAAASARALADAAGMSKDPALRATALVTLGDLAATTEANPDADGDLALLGAQLVSRLAYEQPGDPASQAALSRLARSPDPGVAQVAADAYSAPEVMRVVNADPRLQAQALADLQAIEKTVAVDDQVFRAIGMVRSKEARAHLVARADDPNTSVRAAAVAGLAYDPSAISILIEKAKSDPSDLVQEAARDAIRRLVEHGSEADLLVVYDVVRAAGDALAAEGRPAEDPLRAVLGETKVQLAELLHVDPAKVDKAVAAWKKGDRAALAELLTYASAAELKAFEQAVRPDDLGKVLDVLRRPPTVEGYGDLVQEFARTISMARSWNPPPAGVEICRRALVEHLKRQGTDGLEQFAALTVRGEAEWTIRDAPALGALEVLAEVARSGRDDAVALLIERRVATDPRIDYQEARNYVTRDAIDAALASLPPAQVDRVAQKLMNDASRPTELREAAAVTLTKAGTVEGRRAAGRFFQKKIDGSSAALAAEVARTDEALRTSTKKLNDLYRLKALADAGEGKLTAASYKHLLDEIDGLEKSVRGWQAERSKHANEIGRLLGDADVGAALASLPDAEVERTVTSAIQHLSGTEAGRSLVEKSLAPAVQDLDTNPLWKKVLTNANLAKTVGLDLVTKLSPELALKSERAALRALEVVVGASTSADVAKVEAALLELAAAKAAGAGHAARVKAAEDALSELGFKGSGTIAKVNAAFTAVNFAVGVKDLYENPSFRAALSTAKDTAELIAIAGELSPRLANAGKLAGRASGVLTAALGTYDFVQSAGRDDTAGMLADGATVVGGVLMVIPATAPIGAIIVIGAQIGKWIWGDDEQEQELKSLAEKYGFTFENI